jgi:hypothetical protein
MKRRLMDSSGAVEQISKANQVDMYLHVLCRNMKVRRVFSTFILVLKEEKFYIYIYHLIAIFFGSSMRR